MRMGLMELHHANHLSPNLPTLAHNQKNAKHLRELSQDQKSQPLKVAIYGVR